MAVMADPREAAKVRQTKVNGVVYAEAGACESTLLQPGEGVRSHLFCRLVKKYASLGKPPRQCSGGGEITRLRELAARACA
jgi:hypothetical protein